MRMRTTADLGRPVLMHTFSLSNPPLPPDGIYKGKWTAYTIRFTVADARYICMSLDGVRGIDEPVWVKIEDGHIRFYESKPRNRRKEGKK